jgi:chemotaxis protein histidine kinase CheA
LTEKLDDIPIIGSFVRLSKALGALSAGNWKMAGIYLASVVPGISWIFNKETLDAAEKNHSTKSFTQIIKNALNNKIRNMIKYMPGFIKNPILKMLGMGEEPDEAETQSKPKASSKPEPDEVETQSKPKASSKPSEIKKVHALPRTNKTEDITSSRILKSKPKPRPLLNLQKKMPTTVNPPLVPANTIKKKDSSDLVLKRNADSQKFKPIDRLATRDEKMVAKLADAIQDKQNTNKQNKQIADQMHTDVDRLLKHMNVVMDTILSTSRISKRNEKIPVMQGELSGIPGDAGDIRDPAYVLRSRAWDRLRKGYVVI